MGRLLSFSGLLGSEKEELKFSGGRRVEAFAHENLLALAHDEDWPLTPVVDLLVRRGFGGWIANDTGVFFAQLGGLELGEFLCGLFTPPGR